MSYWIFGARVTSLLTRFYQDRVSQPQHYQHFGSDHPLLSCAIVGMFSSFPGLQPLDVSSEHPSFQISPEVPLGGGQITPSSEALIQDTGFTTALMCSGDNLFKLNKQTKEWALESERYRFVSSSLAFEASNLGQPNFAGFLILLQHEDYDMDPAELQSM